MALPSEREDGQPRLMPSHLRLECQAHVLEEGHPAAGHQRLESRVPQGPDGGHMGPQSLCCLVHKVSRHGILSLDLPMKPHRRLYVYKDRSKYSANKIKISKTPKAYAVMTTES
ncbi:hypothetical protein MJG53_015770 [Ovis ammon polii x Ovis aries]|uniref:Uncharacterized protein n=1 Tax=Ovis ammon polii x Ovis aries TaxID=2918886 RepID=A0ACB9UCT0_9CETA|nr:hypothetical protein MJG53_015770 [Ovis ammon polii x Ovis aries]